jgi:hypothetical protein
VARTRAARAATCVYDAATGIAVGFDPMLATAFAILG